MSEFNREIHAPMMRKLADRGVYIGTSSWNYPGWLGQVYEEGTKFGKTSKHLLSQYAKSFPFVCNDSAYYRLPDVKQLTEFNDILPSEFRMSFKVTEVLTIRRFERHHERKYSIRAGEVNRTFLDPQTFTDSFAKPIIDSLGDKAGPLILEFSPFFFGRSWGQQAYTPDLFINDLDRFFAKLPDIGAKLSVEVRDKEILENPRYFDVLEYHGVAHCMNEQTHMPHLSEQIELPHTATFSVIRALVRPGISHNSAVEEFEPYDRTQLVQPDLREALFKVTSAHSSERRPLYLAVNNRTEGNAPNTIASILDRMDKEGYFM